MQLYKVARAVVSGVLHLLFRIRVEGIENIPTDRNVLVCANHLSLFDPPLLGTCLPVQLRYMAKEELFKNRLFGSLLRAVGAFPIRRGKHDVGALRSAVKMLKDGECVAIFPEGGRSKTKGKMRKGKSGAAMIASKSGVDILPVGICGDYRLFSTMTVRVGKPIPMDAYFDRKVETEELQEMTQCRIMPAIAELAEVETYESANC
ncbi:MAG: 1-acyl-sn-glycerol-3-phosphate acyltransferase [Clostridia bacterium]|nr:1-acyl-sn-glycerol-3-phosphate acyltransferase [Clostridia bacterium]